MDVAGLAHSRLIPILPAMPVTTLSPADLEQHLPHRGVNLFLDEVVIAEDGQSSVASTTVPAGDERGRELLGRIEDGQRVWIEPFLGEMLALAGIPLITEQLAAEGKVAVFSAMSRVEVHRSVAMDRVAEAHAKILRNRGSFVQFGAEIIQDGESCLVAEIMSGGAAMSDITAQPVKPPPAGFGGEALTANFSAKAPSMCFIDGVQAFDAEAGTLTATYVYPEDHPFVPGHFPDAPLMMGVTQWQAIIDAAWEARTRCGIAGPIQAAGRIVRPDGSEVVSIRDIELEERNGLPFVRLTKRIVFREPVRPGDGVLVEVEVAAC